MLFGRPQATGHRAYQIPAWAEYCNWRKKCIEEKLLTQTDSRRHCACAMSFVPPLNRDRLRPEGSSVLAGHRLVNSTSPLLQA
jgi:hypothetical protein